MKKTKIAKLEDFGQQSQEVKSLSIWDNLESADTKGEGNVTDR